jgi:hypothetical protein
MYHTPTHNCVDDRINQKAYVEGIYHNGLSCDKPFDTLSTLKRRYKESPYDVVLGLCYYLFPKFKDGSIRLLSFKLRTDYRIMDPTFNSVDCKYSIGIQYRSGVCYYATVCDVKKMEYIFTSPTWKSKKTKVTKYTNLKTFLLCHQRKMITLITKNNTDEIDFTGSTYVWCRFDGRFHET